MKSIYSPELKGLLYKRPDRDEMNAIRQAVYAVKLFMAEQFLQKKNHWNTIVQSIYSPKLKGLLYKRAHKNTMNRIGRLYIQIRYP